MHQFSQIFPCIYSFCVLLNEVILLLYFILDLFVVGYYTTVDLLMFSTICHLSLCTEHLHMNCLCKHKVSVFTMLKKINQAA